MTWFSDVNVSGEINFQNFITIAKTLDKSIKECNILESDFDPILIADKTPRIVFFSCSNSYAPASVYIGSGVGIVAAVMNAFAKWKREWNSNKGFHIFKLDLVRNIKSIGVKNLTDEIKLDVGINGIALSSNSQLAFLPEQVKVCGILNNNVIDKEQVYQLLAQTPIQSAYFRKIDEEKSCEIYTFETTSFAMYENRVMPLYRGHRVYTKTPKKNNVREHIELTMNYLLKSIQPSGKFFYSFDHSVNEYSKIYNIKDHALTLYAMLEYCTDFAEQSVLETIKFGLHFLTQHMVPIEGDKMVVAEKGEASLDAVAAATIAFTKAIEIYQDDKYLNIITRLGNYILSLIKDNGDVINQKQFIINTIKTTNAPSDDYSSQAALALLKVYKLTRDNKWLDGAQKILSKLIKKENSPLDHWMICALSELCQYSPKKDDAEYLFKMNTTLVEMQNKSGDYEDFVGGFQNPPESLSTAKFSYAIIAAYGLLRDSDYKKEKIKTVFTSIDRCIRFQIQTQFLPETIIYSLQPRKILGGFHNEITSQTIQIDYIAYNLLSLISFYRLIG